MAHAIKNGRKALKKMRADAAAVVALYGPTIHVKESNLALLAAFEYFVEHGYLPGGGVIGTPHRPTRGQKASSQARDAAQALLDIYSPALRSPSGSVCVNPEADSEEQIVLSSEQAAYMLLDAMGRLANTGWLIETNVNLERFLIWYDFKRTRPKHRRTIAALEELAMIHHRSIRDLERVVSGRDWKDG
jgi:hypothetical protein